MMWEMIGNAQLSERYYQMRMPNGLTVLVYPMPDKNGIHAMLSAKIGSVHRHFTLGERHVSAPAGIAHFLEHKLFENEEEDAFSLFAQTGANANAYTTFERTCYLFSATINIEESLRILIRFVTNPMFSAETVQKEQGIIGQEIKMYDDNPDWVLMNMMFKNLYHAHPVNDDIAGSVQSIAEITPEILYDCYNAFYRPSNMVLAVAGNITPEVLEEICAQEYAGIEAPGEAVAVVRTEEPAHVARETSARSMSIFENLFGLAYKEIPFNQRTRQRDETVLRILLDMIAGDTSDLYRALYDEGLVNGMFEASSLSGDDFLCISFSGESSAPETVVARIKEEIARLRREGLDPERFEECKRAMLGAEICGFDSIEYVATKMTACHFKAFALYDTIDTIESVSLEDVTTMMARLLSENSSAVALIRPL